MGAERADLDDLDRDCRKVDRGRGRSEVEDVGDVTLDRHLVADVMLDEFEALVLAQVGETLGPRCQQVVEDEDPPAAVEKRPDHPAADEAGPA